MSGIYIHIPFCNKRCNYCDFYLITNLKVIDKFLLNLKKEISLSAELFKNESFDTVFFGGGTPSILSHLQISDLLNHIYKNFSLDNNSEICIEANPEDFLQKDLSEYRSAGINRMSFGVQSFVYSELKFLTRQHTSEEAEKVIKDALKYFDNINTDIIYSLPSQTLNDIDISLSKAIDLNVNHISAYTLTYEERTPLYKSLQKDLTKKNSNNTEGDFYNFVSNKLTSNGYKHYEVSNFAKEGFQSRHNLKYWEYENYIGFGPSSHSMVNGERWNNFRDIVKYSSVLSVNILPVEERYKLSNTQKKLEYIMLALRSTGINLKKYQENFSEEFQSVFQNSVNELVKNKYAIMSKDNFSLNEKGFAIADEIVAKYF
ncbi:MAG TPA: radical SAM family heme chaperone HemW [Ignavibacteria bacterium]|nr:radical SAM family heme chaperone HemW [Ignavibacteria bacterium]